MAQIQAVTGNYVSQGRHGKYNAVDHSSYTDRSRKVRNFNIYAPENGKITAYGPSGTCGNRIEITSTFLRRRWGVCHLEKSYVAVGTRVKRGQLIGKMGHTGFTIPDGDAGIHSHTVCHDRVLRRYHYPLDIINVPFSVYVPPKPQPSNTNTKYTVVRGDSLSKIAQKYGVTWQSIYQLNRNLIRDPNSISVGWVLNIPPKQGVTYHTVQRGESLSKIAALYGTYWRTIYNWNRGVIGSNPNVIKAGQRLRVR